MITIERIGMLNSIRKDVALEIKPETTILFYR